MEFRMTKTAIIDDSEAIIEIEVHDASLLEVTQIIEKAYGCKKDELTKREQDGE